jgi:hypothetical protein
MATAPKKPAAKPRAAKPAVKDPRDERIAKLEQQNKDLRSQVADLAAQAASGGPATPPVVRATAARSRVAASGFDREARVAELLRQGVGEPDAEEQAAYEERTWNDRQLLG